jgi:hypothetical protein
MDPAPEMMPDKVRLLEPVNEMTPPLEIAFPNDPTFPVSTIIVIPVGITIAPMLPVLLEVGAYPRLHEPVDQVPPLVPVYVLFAT